MNKDIQNQAEKLNKKHRRKRIWYRILSVPVSLVVFVTTYAMILPAITLESTPDTYCGYEEHAHGDECYETPSVPEHKAIQCTAQKALGEGEYIVHTHTDNCFDGGELICTLDEQREHTHSDECYKNGVLVCTKSKAVIHQHTDECIVTIPATEPQGLICTKTEHKHTEGCFVNPANAMTMSASLTANATEVQPDAKTDNDSTSAAVNGRELTNYTTSDGATVYGTAYSDKSTSKIEGEFEGAESDDGKTLTDKSVIYGADDYNAFSSYAENTFSVALSALGQQYENTKQEIVRTPLDVVFILDTSGSMINNTSGSSYVYLDRAEKAVSTLNELAKYVTSINSDNRFGVATFSSSNSSYNNFDSHELLPIGNYLSATSNDILTFKKTGTDSSGYYKSNVSVNTAVSGTSSSNTTYFYGGTYTTAGYYQAYQMLSKTDKASHTVTTKYGDVQRVPIVILITDGVVTYRPNSSYYPYEYSSSKSGQGNSMDNNSLFYTVLSAYHYKQMIGQAYTNNSKLYTIGIGDEAVSNDDLKVVLDPTSENIANLSSTYSTAKGYLQNKTGFPSNYTASYGTEYYFCDGTYSTDTFNPELTTHLKSFIAENSGSFYYTSSQKSRTSIQMTDVIGTGMEIKSGFVLRYDGTNYSMTYVGADGSAKLYRYTGSDTVKANYFGSEVSLSEITVRVDTTSGGNQRITWDIPAELLPEYTHARSSAWYYTMLPVRLLYQVGLTDAELQKVQSMTASSEQLVYYTNYYDGSTPAVTATIIPMNDAEGSVSHNPYYDNFAGETRYKDENTTATDPTFRAVSALTSSGTEQISFSMGNNGKLVFATKKLDLNGTKTSVSAKKIWQDSDGNTVTDASKLPQYITAVLKADGNVYSSQALNAENGWEHTFENLPENWADGSEIVWTVDEYTIPKGYDKTISEEGGGETSVSSLEDGEIYVFEYNGYYLTNANSTTAITASAALSENAQWKAVKQSDGTFKLQNVATGKYLGIQRTRGSWSSYSYSVIAGDGNTSSSYYGSSYYYGWSLSSNRLYQSDCSRYIQISQSYYSVSVGASTSGNATTFSVKKIASHLFVITNRAKANASLTITKLVEAPNLSGEFNFEVSWDGLSAPITFKLKNGESYKLDDIPIGASVTVRELNSDGYCVAFINGNDEQNGIAAYTYTADSDTSLTVRNTADVMLPETGGVGSNLYTYGGIGIMLSVVVLGYLLRRRYGKEGK